MSAPTFDRLAPLFADGLTANPGLVLALIVLGLVLLVLLFTEGLGM